jgi:NADH-quinone oxidoreductase subunit G
MAELSIDGRKVEVPAGTNVIEAARKLAIDIPYYCYHPALAPVGSCRMCQIEIVDPGKPPRVVIACKTEASQGLNVSTTGKDCVAARAATLEFLLANHPLDCPICDKAGECDLQNFSYLHGHGVGRFTEPKRQLQKHELIGDHILLDQERCILCTRCVRFMGEYAKAPQLVVAGRGDRNVIATFPGELMHSNYEGNLADICPVGALTLKEFRFKSRVWDLDSEESVCTLCDRNCSVTLDTKRNRLLRARPRENAKVNGWFMCDVGRFGLLDHCNPSGREESGFLQGARVAPDRAANALADALLADRGRWLVVLSPRLTCEEILLARTVLGPLARALVHVPVAAEGGDAILFTGRRAANARALELLGIEPISAEELARVAVEAATAGVLSFDSVALATLQGKAKLKRAALVDVWRRADPGTVADTAAPLGVEFFVPGTLFTEKAGSFVNCDSRLQRAARVQRPPQGILGEAGLLQELARRSGDPHAGNGIDPTARVLAALGQEPLTLLQLPAEGLDVAPAAPVVAAGEARLA